MDKEELEKLPNVAQAIDQLRELFDGGHPKIVTRSVMAQAVSSIEGAEPQNGPVLVVGTKKPGGGVNYELSVDPIELGVATSGLSS